MLTENEMRQRHVNSGSGVPGDDDNLVIQTDAPASALAATSVRRRSSLRHIDHSMQSTTLDLEETSKENKPWFGARAWNYVKRHPVKCGLIAAAVVFATAVIAAGIFVLPLLGVKLIVIAGVWGALAKAGAIATPTISAGAIWGGCEIVDSCRSPRKSSIEDNQLLVDDQIGETYRREISWPVTDDARNLITTSTAVPARPQRECSLLSWLPRLSFWSANSRAPSPPPTEVDINPVFQPPENNGPTYS